MLSCVTRALEKAHGFSIFSRALSSAGRPGLFSLSLVVAFGAARPGRRRSPR
jgi:hypothetical protein